MNNMPKQSIVNFQVILWHVDQLLGNDRETSNYTTAAPPTDTNATIPRQQEDVIMGSSVFYAVRAEML
jgi:hypothetical protein